MEKRAIIAALLMAGLLIAYQSFFMQPVESPPPPKAEAPGAKPVAAPAPAPTPVAAPATAAPVATPSVPDRSAIVETPLYRAAISSRGGAITIWDVPVEVGRQKGAANCTSHAPAHRELTSSPFASVHEEPPGDLTTTS